LYQIEFCDGWPPADWQCFAAAIRDVLSDAGLRSRIGEQARRTVEERFGWDAIGEAAYRSYLTVAAGRLSLGGAGAAAD
jgi:glycosyltransferase involved in cell wall biosynthesis